MFTLSSPTRASLPINSLRHSTLSLPKLHFPSSSSFRLPSIKASSLNDPPFRTPKNPQTSLPPILQTLNSFLNPVVETTAIVIAATAFFFMRFHSPVIAAPLSPPAAADTSSTTAADEEAEKALEEQLSADPNDIDALHALMEVKIKARKMDEALGVLDRLIEVEPEELEWPLLKANMNIYNDSHARARELFEEVLKKDPLRVEAFHGLIMATAESKESLKGLLKRVEEAMEVCKKEHRDSDVRDFKLLIAQVKVMEGNYSEALKAYQDLVKEEPRDFRPYLCQGIIYTLLKKRDEAEKQFDKFRRLIPKDHPYKEYFEDNMFATKFFSQKLEREGAGARG